MRKTNLKKLMSVILLGGLFNTGYALADDCNQGCRIYPTEYNIQNEPSNITTKVENGITIQEKIIYGPTTKHVLDDEKYYQDSQNNVKRIPKEKKK